MSLSLSALAALLCCSLLVNAAKADAFTALDGGEGLLINLSTPNHSVMVDTGSLLHIRANLKKLESFGHELPTDLVLTHLHPDHASGLFEVYERNPELRVFDACYPNIGIKDGELIRWIDEQLTAIPHRQCLQQGSTLAFDDIAVEVLWPTGDFVPKGHNRNSLVLLLIAGDKQILIMGDVPAAVEAQLLQSRLSAEQGQTLRNIDILVAGHHGSASASSEAFLEWLKPKLTLVAANADNIRGYPDAEVLARLQRFSGRVWVTGQDGDLHIPSLADYEPEQE